MTLPIRSWRAPARLRAFPPILGLAALVTILAIRRNSFAYASLAFFELIVAEVTLLYWLPRANLWADRVELRGWLRRRTLAIHDVHDVRARFRGLEFVGADGRPFMVPTLWGNIGLLTMPAARRAATEDLAIEVLAAVRAAQSLHGTKD